MGQWTRRKVLALGAALMAGRGQAQAPEALGLEYLEALGLPGALHESVAYLPPSRLHPAYSHAFYINASHDGPAMQKMWVIARQGSDWTLALRDDAYWADRGGPAGWSWPVSTGIRAAGNPPYRLTPLGIYNIDERPGRQVDGWGSPGMYRSFYIDLHYASGRISAVAMHGTTRSAYPQLGERASHGCIRMTQGNADQVWALLHPGGARRSASPLWGQVPRYFRSSPRDSLSTRYGYVTDGTLLYDDNGALLTKAGYRAIIIIYRDDLA